MLIPGWKSDCRLKILWNWCRLWRLIKLPEIQIDNLIKLCCVPLIRRKHPYIIDQGKLFCSLSSVPVLIFEFHTFFNKSFTIFKRSPTKQLTFYCFLSSVLICKHFFLLTNVTRQTDVTCGTLTSHEIFQFVVM